MTRNATLVIMSTWSAGVEGTPGVVHRNNRRELSFDPATVNAPEATEENTGEEMRLAYVAMTRAQSGLVLWWAGTKQNTSKSALHRLLFGQASGPEALDEVAASHLTGLLGGTEDAVDGGEAAGDLFGDHAAAGDDAIPVEQALGGRMGADRRLCLRGGQG